MLDGAVQKWRKKFDHSLGSGLNLGSAQYPVIILGPLKDGGVEFMLHLSLSIHISEGILQEFMSSRAPRDY